MPGICPLPGPRPVYISTHRAGRTSSALPLHGAGFDGFGGWDNYKEGWTDPHTLQGVPWDIHGKAYIFVYIWNYDGGDGVPVMVKLDSCGAWPSAAPTRATQSNDYKKESPGRTSDEASGGTTGSPHGNVSPTSKSARRDTLEDRYASQRKNRGPQSGYQLERGNRGRDRARRGVTNRPGTANWQASGPPPCRPPEARPAPRPAGASRPAQPPGRPCVRPSPGSLPGPAVRGRGRPAGRARPARSTCLLQAHRPRPGGDRARKRSRVRK